MAVYQQKQAGRDPIWIVDFKWTDPQTGKTTRVRKAAKDIKGRPAKSETAAEAHEQRLRTELATPIEPSARKAPTLAQFRAEYFGKHQIRNKDSQRAAQNTIWDQRLIPLFEDRALNAIGVDQFDTLISTMLEEGRAPKTINNALSALRTALVKAKEWHPDWGIEIPKVAWLKKRERAIPYLTTEELQQLFKHAPPMVIVAAKTGLRLGELRALQWDRVHPHHGTPDHIVIDRGAWGKKVGTTKSGRERTIPLPPAAAAELAALRSIRARGECYVFPGEAGGLATKGECKWPLWTACSRAKVKRVGWHVLRHTFCSHLAMRGVDVLTIQKLAGHATLAMTQRYMHLAPNHARAVMAAF